MNDKYSFLPYRFLYYYFRKCLSIGYCSYYLNSLNFHSLSFGLQAVYPAAHEGFDFSFLEEYVLAQFVHKENN